jgi:hypothetical protein
MIGEHHRCQGRGGAENEESGPAGVEASLRMPAQVGQRSERHEEEQVGAGQGEAA